MKKISLLLLIPFLFSCKKDKFHKESVSGIVVHNITKQPLANQTVLITITTFKVGLRNDEFPNGRPIYTDKSYTTTTDNAGRFVLDVKTEEEWIYSAHIVPNSGYAEKSIRAYIIFPGYNALATARARYDTLFAEKPAYIKYHIKNISPAVMEDNLFVSTYYEKKRIWPGSFSLAGYNWWFTGISVDQTIIDTIPAESEQVIPIVWLHKKYTDTVVFKNETINVQPFATIDYTINY